MRANLPVVLITLGPLTFILVGLVSTLISALTVANKVAPSDPELDLTFMVRKPLLWRLSHPARALQHSLRRRRERRAQGPSAAMRELVQESQDVPLVDFFERTEHIINTELAKMSPLQTAEFHRLVKEGRSHIEALEQAQQTT